MGRPRRVFKVLSRHGAKFSASQVRTTNASLMAGLLPSYEVVLLHKIEGQGDNGKASIVSFLNGAHANNTVDNEPPKLYS